MRKRRVLVSGLKATRTVGLSVLNVRDISVECRCWRWTVISSLVGISAVRLSLTAHEGSKA